MVCLIDFILKLLFLSKSKTLDFSIMSLGFNILGS